jgi:hypothetical protein
MGVPGQPFTLLRKAALLLARRSLPQSCLGKACRYLLGQWDALAAHCDHGDTRLDTNLLENAIRPSAIGKKNFLFIGHPDAGDRSAIIYSIVVSCQRRAVDPLDYIRDDPHATVDHDHARRPFTPPACHLEAGCHPKRHSM